MHELSIAMALVKQVESIASEQKASAVRKVAVMVGALSGVDPEALRGAFPLAAEGTLTAGAELVIAWVPASVWCKVCGKASSPESPFIYCEGCASTTVDIETGRELCITSVEVEVAEQI